ncbi:hypothetical protein STCU_05808 [Strigomonas culicis]|uniref:Membrane-associated protein n=1 Tax=Strigomonas culicis TaxID=28005 RepID=S9UF19_9TRYP|nr:hypothetical protein STCU_05808 [Strigomonas culicis]|eukprot:EPY27324.1 hypothetical protein STCU_05808 [Strigomonas culicis]
MSQKLITAVILLSVLFIQTALAYNACVEDQRTYTVGSGEGTYGAVTFPSLNTDGATLILELTESVASPANMAIVQGWTYLFVAPTLSATASAQQYHFTVRALSNGAEVCQATIYYTVTASDSSASSTAVAYPSTCGTTTNATYAPAVTYLGTLPFDGTSVTCANNNYEVKLTQPSIGSAFPFGAFTYLYAAPAMTEDATTVLPYTVYCTATGAEVCSSYVTITIHEESPACANSQLPIVVPPGSTTSGTFALGNTCSGDVTWAFRQADAAGTLTMGPGLAYTFAAPASEQDSLYTIRYYCDQAPLCDVAVAFLVTDATTTTSTTSTTATPDSSTTSTSTTSTTTTTAAPLETCGTSFLFEVPTGQSLRGSINVSLASSHPSCQVVTYGLLRNASILQGTLSINLIGDFLYQAPSTETVEIAIAQVSCVTTPVCQATVTFVSYFTETTSTQAPVTTTSTAVPVQACASVYYYTAVAGVALSSSLNGMPGQDPCAFGRYFFVNTLPQAGTLDLLPNGDFSYIAPTTEGQYDFKFSMMCLNKVYCVGYAYFMVSHEATTTSSPDESNTSTITNPQITCQGSCTTQPWLTYPNYALWDNSASAGYTRKDGNAVDGVSASWSNHSLVLTVYSLIGNLGVRFPTFEAVTSSSGTYFESSDFASTVAVTSPGFEMSCLNGQGRVGMGEDVWKWSTLNVSTGTGTPGTYYALGSSWYQKFGGKHNKCDTFVNSCLYAPLLTPSNKTGSVGKWSIDINDCDATWTGVFPHASLSDVKRANGTSVFEFVGENQIKGTLLSEAVRASSWVAPGRFQSEYEAHDIVIDMEEFVYSTKDDSVKSLFSVDVEFFTARDDSTSDRTFGINLLVYPYVTSSMKSSYAADRHFVGFKWVEQAWEAPSSALCPTCTGTGTHCFVDGDSTEASFTGDFPTGNCSDSTARVVLSKGPSFSSATCASNDMHVYNTSGFSAPRSCKTSYQNITLRGTVPGSGKLTEALSRQFYYGGVIRLQLLTNEGMTHDLTLNMSMYVSRLSLNAATVTGGLNSCRSGPYWPVLDPLGTSLPDTPLDLSLSTATYLCVDDLSTTFGPSDWALFTVNLPGVSASDVTLNEVYCKINGTRVYLLYRNSTGSFAVPPSSAGKWWAYEYPFLAFRDLTARALNNNLTASAQMSSSSVLSNVVRAFTFIPGAISLDGEVEVTVEATVVQDGVTTRTTFRHMVSTDPQLTYLSREGPAAETSTDTSALTEGFYALGVTVGIVAVVIIAAVFFMLADNNRPLPKWVPRGKLVKETVLSVLPPGMRKKKQEKLATHKDMYDAMGSGKY